MANRVHPEIEKAVLGNQTLLTFCEQFGHDVYGQILLEVLLEGIMNEEAVFVFGEQEQTRTEACDSLAGGGNSQFGPDGPQQVESSTDLGEETPTNHP